VNNVGVAAHICGALPGSARYDAAMTSGSRSHADNGIWLCQTCAKKVDSDAAEWTVLKLVQVKVRAEQRAKDRLGVCRRKARARVVVDATECHFVRHFSAAAVPVHLVNEGPRAVTVRRVELVLDGSVYEPSKAIETLSVGIPWLAPPPLRLLADDAATGAWFFGRTVFGGGRAVEAKPGATAELVVHAVGSDPIRMALQFVHPDDSVRGVSISGTEVSVRDDGSVR
jgi:hypothetical protein